MTNPASVTYSFDKKLNGTSIKASFSLSSSTFVPLSWRRKSPGTASLYYIGALGAPALTTLCKSHMQGKNDTIQTQNPTTFKVCSRRAEICDILPENHNK